MDRAVAKVLRAVVGLGSGIWLVVAAMNPQPAMAQQLWAAVAISPSTGVTGECHADPSQANAELSAVHYCSQGGYVDCKVVAAAAGACVALAKPARLVVNQYGYGTDATREGAAAQALAACVKVGGVDCVVAQAPCASDDPRWAPPLPLPPPQAPPLPVDPGLVGSWKMSLVGGIWVWQIAANGTYTFNSETGDNTPTHNGSFTASNGKYSLHAYNITWDDQGTYTIQPGGNSVVMTGKLGTGTWIRITNDPILNSIGNGVRN